MKRINLIPQGKRIDYNWYSITKVFLVKDFPRPVMITLILCLLITILQFVDTLRLKSLISSRKDKIALLDKESGRYEKLNIEIKAEKEAVLRSKKHIEDKMLIIKRIKEDTCRWSVILEDISKLIPANVSLKGASLNKDSITITGTTLDNLAVSKFMQSLDDSTDFRDTNFSYTRKEKIKDEEGKEYEIINFGLTTYLERQYGL